MRTRIFSASVSRPRPLGPARVRVCAPALLAIAATLAIAAPAQAAAGEAQPAAQAPLAGAAASGTPQPGSGGGPGSATASLEQCLTSSLQAERSATFAGEMSTTGATARMSMRIEVQEWMPSDETFRTVTAPGLGVWRSSVPGVKVYRYLKQVTNLSASALYRAAVRFRWMNAKGKQIRSLERRTPSCLQPAPESSQGAPAGQ